MIADSQSVADVLLPLALEGPYSYRIPEGMTLRAGDYVLVPLGPRAAIGVVWALRDAAPEGKKLRDVAQRFDMPAMTETHRKFVDWLAAYYLEPPGNVLRMVLRSPGAFEGPREQVAYRASGTPPKRMTPQRARILEIAREGFAMRAAELAEAAGVGASVVKAMARDGGLEEVALRVHLQECAARDVLLRTARKPRRRAGHADRSVRRPGRAPARAAALPARLGTESARVAAVTGYVSARAT